MITALLLGLLGIAALALLTRPLRALSRLTFTIWAIVLFFVPVWIGMNVRHVFVSAITILTLVAIVAFGEDLRLSMADLLMAILVLLTVVQTVLGAVELTYAATTVLEWMLPYIWGRLVLARVPSSFVVNCIAICAIVTAGLAVVEFATQTNIFSLVPFDNSLYQTWGTPQDRSGILRAQAAWGHSIALGAALAMSSAFIMATRWRPVVRVLALVLVAAATAATLSRLGLLTLVFVLVLTIVLLPGIGRTVRTIVAVVGVLGAMVIVPLLNTVLTNAGTEASGSADYRVTLLSLFGHIQTFGSAPDVRGTTIGDDLGSLTHSIDNTILLTGLRLGWVCLAVFCVIIALAVAPTFRRNRATPASIAIAATVPSLFGVALITQFGMYFWFLIGLAVAWDVRHRDEEAADEAAGRSAARRMRRREDSAFPSEGSASPGEGASGEDAPMPAAPRHALLQSPPPKRRAQELSDHASPSVGRN